MPKISIIIPTYQHEKFIAQCLASVLKQTFLDWEAIIVDDGSKDNTAEIIKDFMKKDNRVHYFYQENKGIYRLSELYNFALEKAEGELIAILEGDDYWPEEKLAEQIKAFDNPNVILSWGDGMIDVAGELSALPGYRGFADKNEICNSPVGSALEPLMFHGHFFEMPTCSVMYRKEGLQKIGGFYQPKGLPWLDRSTWAVLACVGEFSYKAINLGVWRRHPQQVTQNNKDLRTTFDFIFDDRECPKILKLKIAKYKTDYSVYSNFVRSFRSLSLMNLLLTTIAVVRHPITSVNLFRRFQRSKCS